MVFNKLKMAAIAALTFAAVSCSNDSDSDAMDQPATLTVNLIDAPGDYQEVNIDVQDVMISTEDGGWESLANVNAGVYNLLDFTNGLDTLLTSYSSLADLGIPFT